MVNYARIQHKIDKGLGIAGRHLGPGYTATRVDVNASGDFPSGWSVIASKVPVFLRRTSDSKIFSSLLASGTMWFDVIGNMERFLLGDVFQLADAPYAPGRSFGVGATSVAGALQFNGFGLAWHAPVDEPVGARLDRRLRIVRPQGPADTNLATGGQTWRATTYASAPLVLTDGVFSFEDPYSGQEPSWVPGGFASTDRPPRGRLLSPPTTPGDMSIPRYFVYLPPLPGYVPKEGDRIIEESGARYIVTNAYRQTAGVVGAQLGVERRIGED